jgi:iron complex transport system substrate-binding protein
LRRAGEVIVQSPCVGICRLDANGVCVGCWRSIAEIAAWSSAEDVARLRSLAAAEIRRRARESMPMNDLRIVSFLPSATELACALGLEEFIVGISHECDFPLSIRSKPMVVHSALPVKTMGLGEIDVAVSERLKSGASLYEVDIELLRELRPTHILTQDLCQVCAPAGNEVSRALNALPSKPQVIWMSPHSISDIHNDLRNLALLVGREAMADRIIAQNNARLLSISENVSGEARRRVFCAEWIDPLYCCGHWVPEQVEIAGGFDPLGRKWNDSVRVNIDDVMQADPEFIMVMPCGFGVEGASQQAREFATRFPRLNAVKSGRVYAVDASYFSRPGLRVVNGTELLAHILHSQRCSWRGPKDAFARIKTCPQCDAAFTCGADSIEFNCWCEELPPLPRSAINSNGCLCRACLLDKLAVK